MTVQWILALAAAGAFALSGCSKTQPSSDNNSGGAAPNTSAAHDDHDHNHGDDHDHAHDEPMHGTHGPVIDLGTATIGGWTVRAARDQGEITPGGDSPIDVWLTGGTGNVVAVRFWIGLDSAEGSIKARADIENPDQPNHWHTHAEIPSPMPEGSRLWVEIEIEGAGKQVGSFDLLM